MVLGLLNDCLVFDQRPFLRGLGAGFRPAGEPVSGGRHIGYRGLLAVRINLDPTLIKIIFFLRPKDTR